MKLRVRANNIVVDFLLNEVAVPELPDWSVELQEQLPESFSGKSLLLVGTSELIVTWDFYSGLVTDMIQRLNSDSTLDNVATWGQNTFKVYVNGNETTAAGLLGVMVER